LKQAKIKLGILDDGGEFAKNFFPEKFVCSWPTTPCYQKKKFKNFLLILILVTTGSKSKVTLDLNPSQLG
jgi:hypothetical protein